MAEKNMGFIAKICTHAWISCFILIAACNVGENAPALKAGPEVDVVKALTAAFNAHDPDKMRSYWSDDVTWFDLAGDEMWVITTNADELYQELVSYFEVYPDVSSTLESIAINGNYVTAIERPVWKSKGVEQSQASIVVYEVIDGKVKRFWYYPPQ